MQNSIKIFALYNFFRYKLIFLIELLNTFKIIPQSLMIDGFINILGFIIGSERLLNNRITKLNFLLHTFIDRVFKRS